MNNSLDLLTPLRSEPPLPCTESGGIPTSKPKWRVTQQSMWSQMTALKNAAADGLPILPLPHEFEFLLCSEAGVFDPDGYYAHRMLVEELVDLYTGLGYTVTETQDTVFPTVTRWFFKKEAV